MQDIIYLMDKAESIIRITLSNIRPRTARSKDVSQDYKSFPTREVIDIKKQGHLNIVIHWLGKSLRHRMPRCDTWLYDRNNITFSLTLP